jgi:S-DNA-T family DNA segregation ATPase FtsK/SpoIIIE
MLAAGIAGCFMPPPTWPLPTGLGGVFGDMVLKLPAMFIGTYPEGWAARLIALVLALPTAGLFAYASALIARGPLPEKIEVKKTAPAATEADLGDEDEDDEGGFSRIPLAILGAITHWYLVCRSLVRRKLAVWRESRQDAFETARSERGGWRRAAQQVELAEMEETRVTASGGRARVEPEFFAQMVAERRGPNDYAEEPDDGSQYVDGEADPSAFGDGIAIPAANATVQQFRTPEGARSARVDNPAPRPTQGARVQREAQTSFISSGKFEMPSLHFLAEAKSVGKDPSLSKDALEQNARLLEGVLEDFGVKGEIIHVRPGPVVTLYELEPAPGIKSSRVIGLADDIARSMSAIACRVAVVPGRNAIGIELPNTKRETVYLREILASKDFEQSKHKLALALGSRSMAKSSRSISRRCRTFLWPAPPARANRSQSTR